LAYKTKKKQPLTFVKKETKPLALDYKRKLENNDATSLEYVSTPKSSFDEKSERESSLGEESDDEERANPFEKKESVKHETFEKEFHDDTNDFAAGPQLPAKDSQKMLEAFHQGLMNFPDDDQAVAAVEKFLKDSYPSSVAANTRSFKTGKTLLSLLLDHTSQHSVDLNLRVTKLLLDHGAKIDSADIDQALKSYRSYADNHNLGMPKTFLGKLISRFLKTDAQQEEMQKYHNLASKFAEIVFMLDDAAPKNVVDSDQGEKIMALEVQYKNVWQRTYSWWSRIFKK
jgi:hypothetical protein